MNDADTLAKTLARKIPQTAITKQVSPFCGGLSSLLVGTTFSLEASYPAGLRAAVDSLLALASRHRSNVSYPLRALLTLYHIFDERGRIMCKLTERAAKSSTHGEKSSAAVSTGANGKNGSSVSLFDRLGGFAAVSAVVEDFYRRILEDKRLAHFFYHANMTNLMTHQIRFLKFAFTTPEHRHRDDQYQRYIDVPSMLLEKHLDMFINHGLNEKHFDMVAIHLVDTFRSFDIDEVVIQESLHMIAPLRSVFSRGARAFGQTNQRGDIWLSRNKKDEASRRTLTLSNHKLSYNDTDSVDNQDSFSGFQSFDQSETTPGSDASSTTSGRRRSSVIFGSFRSIFGRLKKGRSMSAGNVYVNSCEFQRA